MATLLMYDRSSVVWITKLVNFNLRNQTKFHHANFCPAPFINIHWSDFYFDELKNYTILQYF